MISFICLFATLTFCMNCINICFYRPTYLFFPQINVDVYNCNDFEHEANPSSVSVIQNAAKPARCGGFLQRLMRGYNYIIFLSASVCNDARVNHL